MSETERMERRSVSGGVEKRPASIELAGPRTTAQVTLADGRVFEGPVGTPLALYLHAAYGDDYPAMAALVNGRLEELSWLVERDADVSPLDTSTSDGMRIYQRSVSFVMVVAIRELFPKARVVIDHSVPLGGFFCRIEGRPLFNCDELDMIQRRMHEIVEADELIVRERLPVAEAQRVFDAQGYDDKVALLRYREQPKVPVYTLRGVRDYFYGYMAWSTGLLRWFSLTPCPPGFILRLPLRSDPAHVPPERDRSKLLGIFEEYGRWLNILGVHDVASLNATIDDGEINRAILVSEALHEKNIVRIADDILARREHARLVLIAGPSSSGKTTFTHRLAIQLLVNGLKPFAIGLDDYFVDRTLTPLDEHGVPDFESLYAVNLELFNQQLEELVAGRPVRLPHFDFVAGKSQLGEPTRLPENATILVEGIHGLNPELIQSRLVDKVYRVYVSALTQLNIDQHNRVATTDTRLLRRIVRDAAFRGYTAQSTIERWESVRRGEERNIFPYQENADATVNTALAYELAVLKPFAEPLLLRVPQNSLASVEARRLLGFIQWVRPCPPDLVPANSLLREFIGGSAFQELVF